MAFEPSTTRTPTSIGEIRIELIDEPDPANPGEVLKSGWYRFVVYDQDGKQLVVPSGNLLPHLSPEQAQQISDFLDWCRAQAEATLPEA